jgi:transcriptional regulator with XRE-family HTH domain
MPSQKHPHLILIGQRIRALRQERGYSQEGFAAHAGIDRSYYGAIERGERNLSVLTLLQLAYALQVEPGRLLPSLFIINR